MKTACIACLCLASVKASEPSGNFLNVAILHLPACYFADIPLKERALFLQSLSDTVGDTRLDYAHGWLHWYSDSEAPPHGTSMLYVKLLPRSQDDTPLVFVHMPKPFATSNGSSPKDNQTFVLEWKNEIGGKGKWLDVTKLNIPETVGLTLHFSPRRTSNVIEVGKYELYNRDDKHAYRYTFGEHTLDLIWNGEKFEIRKSESKLLADDDIWRGITGNSMEDKQPDKEVKSQNPSSKVTPK